MINIYGKQFFNQIFKACLGDTFGAESDDPGLLNYKIGFATGICKLGHEGVLCHECSVGYTKFDDTNCVKCGDSSWNIFVMVFRIVFRISFTFYTLLKAYLLSDSLRETGNTLEKSLVVYNFMIKIIVLHFIFLKTMLGFPFSLQKDLAFLMNFLTFTISSSMPTTLNLDCLIKSPSLPLRYIYNIITIVAPFFFAVFIRYSVLIISIIFNPKRSTKSFAQEYGYS